MAIPSDALEEIQRELVESCRALMREADRVAQLIELNRLALLVSLRRGRRISIVDLYDELGDEDGQLVKLIRSLRDERAR
jgi:hypothetical protein